MDNCQTIIDKTLQGDRLIDCEALELLKKSDLLALGHAANELKQQKHTGTYVTFIVDRNINYTNICTSKCQFCVFYRSKTANDAYVLNTEAIYEKAAETVAAGGTQIMLQSGLNTELTLKYYEDILKERLSKHVFPLLYILFHLRRS